MTSFFSLLRFLLRLREFSLRKIVYSRNSDEIACLHVDVAVRGINKIHLKSVGLKFCTELLLLLFPPPRRWLTVVQNEITNAAAQNFALSYSVVTVSVTEFGP